MKQAHLLFPALALLLLFGASWLSFSPCAPIRRAEPEQGSHGFHTWYGGSFLSFPQEHQKICVPEGWRPVGEEKAGRGWAIFPKGVTGVLMREDAFASTTLSFERSPYVVSMVYPKATSPEHLAAYEAMVRRAFEEVAALYDDSTVLSHTVFVTAGISFSPKESASIYPDPGPDVSYLILPPENSRSEELFTHAVMHLNNRQRSDLDTYAGIQTEFGKSGFEEAEAAWSETALTTFAPARAERLSYLYRIHESLMAKDDRTHEEPFQNARAFSSMRAGLPERADWTHEEDQYNFYVLAPLSLIATEGLLARHDGATIAELLRRVHKNGANFFEELAKELPAEKVEEVRAWISGKRLIPEALVFEGLERYER